MLIGGLDVGTTGCKLTVYNDSGEFVYNSYIEYDVSRESGKHEIDANVIYSSVCKVIKDVYSKYSVDVIGVTTFGESFVALGENDEVLLPVMLYTDPRGEEECKVLCGKLGEEHLTDILGVKPHSMYSLPKVMWIKNNLPDTYKKIKRILLMEDFIVYMLSGKACIDYSLAARAMALDIRKKEWSDEILCAAGVDKELFSQPVPTGHLAGTVRPEVARELGMSEDVKIVCGAHDQVASAVGAGVFEVGRAVDGTGTVECVTPVFDKIPDNKKLYDENYSVVPYVFDGTYVCYALSYTGGAVLKWYRDNFAKYEKELADKKGTNVFAELDNSIPDAPTDILVMPHFAGAANPYMDTGSRAAMIGLTLEHTNKDIYKALMEGVTYEIMLNLEHLEAADIKLESLYATGGGASSPVWLQIKADILNRPITAIDAKEVGALGTCMLAGCAVGAFADLYEARNIFVKMKKTFTPNPEYAKIYSERYKAYRRIYEAVRPIVEEVN